MGVHCERLQIKLTVIHFQGDFERQIGQIAATEVTYSALSGGSSVFTPTVSNKQQSLQWPCAKVYRYSE